MKNSLLKTTLVAGAAALAISASANERMAMLIGYDNIDAIDNFQEFAAANYFKQLNPDGVVIAPGETSKIDASKVNCIWVHIDRLEIGKGNLPEAFGDQATLDALKKFLADGGNLLLTKQATQMVHMIGRTDAAFAPNIYGDGQGGEGTDVWTLNAQIGYFNRETAPEQFYDQRNHPIFKDLQVSNAFEHESYPMEGTADGTPMHREDHNCMWDLNGFQYTAEGANTVEKFQNENNAVVLGSWGHVVDYAVAGVVEFNPSETVKGRIIANGLAACEWAPRSGVNAYHSNLEKLTANCLDYLKGEQVAIEEVTDDNIDAPVEYFNLQGMSVSADMLAPGIYIKRQGDKASKVLVK